MDEIITVCIAAFLFIVAAEGAAAVALLAVWLRGEAKRPAALPGPPRQASDAGDGEDEEEARRLQTQLRNIVNYNGTRKGQARL